MNKTVETGLDILRDIFDKHAKYQDEQGDTHCIKLESVAPNIQIKISPEKTVFLSFSFQDHAKKNQCGTVFLPADVQKNLPYLKEAIKKRQLDFGGC